MPFTRETSLIPAVDKDGRLYNAPLDTLQDDIAAGSHVATQEELQREQQLEAIREGKNEELKQLENEANGDFWAKRYQEYKANMLGQARGTIPFVFDPAVIGAAGLFGGEQGAADAREELKKYKRGLPTASYLGEIGAAGASLLMGSPAGAAKGAASAAKAANGLIHAGEAAQETAALWNAAHAAGNVQELAGGIQAANAAAKGAEAANVARAMGMESELANAAGHGIQTAEEISGAGKMGMFQRAMENNPQLLVDKFAAKAAGVTGEHWLPRAAVRNAINAASQQASDELSEVALGDHEFSAEKVLAAGLMGAALGVGIEGVGRGVGSGARGVAEYIDRAKAASIANKEEAATADLASRYGLDADSVQAFRNAGGKVTHDTEASAKLAAEIVDEYSAKLKDLYKKVDNAVPQPSPEDIAGSVKRVTEEAMKAAPDRRAPLSYEPQPGVPPLKESPKFLKFQDAVTRELSGADANIGTLSGITEYASKLEDRIAGTQNKTEKSALSAIRDALKSEITVRENHASSVLGGDIQSEIQAYKRNAAIANDFYKALSTESKRYKAPPSDAKENWQADAVKRAAYGFAFGGPKGAAVGAGSAFVSHAMHNGFRDAAENSLQHMGAVSNTLKAIGHVDRVIADVVPQLVKPATAAASSLARRHSGSMATRKQYDETVQALQEARDGQHAEWENATREARVANAKLAAQMDAKRQAAIAAAFSRMPSQDVYAVRSLAGPRVKPAQLTFQENAFMRYMKGLTNPVQTLKLLASGEASMDHMDGLREGWPKLYDHVVQETMKSIAMRPVNAKPVPLERRTQLSILLGIPMDYSTQPGFMSDVQNIIHTQLQPPQSKSSPPDEDSVTESMKTETDKLQE